MKRAFLSLYITLLPLLLYSQRIDSLSIHSKHFERDRKIWIYTPWEYDNKPDSKYEVVYVFDAQARRYFDNVHSTLGFMNRSQVPMIVVGIVSEERNKDFLPKNENPETYKWYKGVLGGADKFMSFMSDELIPYIDSHYRTYPTRIAVGHSNGGTFITYCLLKNPAMFDVFIAISPNLAYDSEQLVKMLEKFDATQLNSRKYIYTCHADEGNDWVAGKKKAVALFKSKSFKDKITITDDDFSATLDHTTVFPTGVANGLRNYFQHQFFDVDNLIAYYSYLNEKNELQLTPQMIKDISRPFLYENSVEDAAKILLWGIQLHPNEISFYNHLAEMYQGQKRNTDAIKYYRIFLEKISATQEIEKEELGLLKTTIEARIKQLAGE